MYLNLCTSIYLIRFSVPYYSSTLSVWQVCVNLHTGSPTERSTSHQRTTNGHSFPSTHLLPRQNQQHDDLRALRPRHALKQRAWRHQHAAGHSARKRDPPGRRRQVRRQVPRRLAADLRRVAEQNIFSVGTLPRRRGVVLRQHHRCRDHVLCRTRWRHVASTKRRFRQPRGHRAGRRRRRHRRHHVVRPCDQPRLFYLEQSVHALLRRLQFRRRASGPDCRHQEGRRAG